MLALGGVLLGLATDIGTNLVEDAVSGSGGSGASGSYCPGQPSAAAIVEMISSATAAERTQLDRHWRNTGSSHGALFSDGAMTQLRITPQSYAFNVWGGNDCKLSTDLSSAGNQQKSYVQSLLAKYTQDSVAGGNVLPPVTYTPPKPDIIDQAVEEIKQAGQAGLAAVGGSLAGSTASAFSRNTEYTVLPDWVPWLLGGIAVVALIVLFKR